MFLGSLHSQVKCWCIAFCGFVWLNNWYPNTEFGEKSPRGAQCKLSLVLSPKTHKEKPCYTWSSILTFPLRPVPGVRGVMSSSVPGSGDSSGSESSPGLSGASAEPQPDGGGPRWLDQSRRQTRWLLSAIWCGEWYKSLFWTTLFKHTINKYEFWEGSWMIWLKCKANVAVLAIRCWNILKDVKMLGSDVLSHIPAVMFDPVEMFFKFLLTTVQM